MKKIKLLIPYILLISLNTFAESKKETTEKEIIQVTQTEVDIKKLSTRERIALKIEEKNRLRVIAPRREKTDDLSISNFYLENIKETELTKSFLRETLFYTKYLVENHKNKELIEKESTNISWNSLCLATQIPAEKYYIVFETLLSLELDTNEKKEKYESANIILVNSFKDSVNPTQEEISIRCLEIY